MDLHIIIAGIIVGFLVGLTGMGGGALMTPILITLFGISPAAAISSDLVAAVIMKPFGSAVHIGKKTVNKALVGWLALGSIPGALGGAWILNQIATKGTEADVKTALGVALLLGAAGMLFRLVRSRSKPLTEAASIHV